MIGSTAINIDISSINQDICLILIQVTTHKSFPGPQLVFLVDFLVTLILLSSFTQLILFITLFQSVSL